MGSISWKNAAEIVRTTMETIDMHFILLVYKYEYIINKSSYFVDLFRYRLLFPGILKPQQALLCRAVSLSEMQPWGCIIAPEILHCIFMSFF